ncbi:MAG: TolC family protein [Candidatus Hydrogenedentes bacterium]|nr:TolC family protein [Candidatus Hydrogenedentota bacterium]
MPTFETPFRRLAFAALWVSALASAQQVDSVGAALPSVLDLESAQRVALSENPSLMAVGARVEQALERIKQARSAYYPALDASYTASVTELSDRAIDETTNAARASALAQIPSILAQLPGAFPLSTLFSGVGIVSSVQSVGDGIDDTVESYGASLSATWLIFDGFGRKFSVAAARFGAKETEAGLAEARRLLLAGVARAFYGVQLARENIAIAEADLDFNKRQLSEAEARQRVGTGALSDVLNFQVRVKSAESALLEAERSYAVTLISLAELMGLSGAAFPADTVIVRLREEAAGDMALPELGPLLEYADAHRPDLAQSRSAVSRFESMVEIQKSALWPSVSAFASQDGVRSRNGYFDSDDFASTVGVSVQYNLYSGGRRRAVINEAKAFHTEAKYSEHNTKLLVAADVREAMDNLSTAQKELVLQRDTTDLVDRNRSLVERGYNAGQESLVRLNEAQRDLIAQQSRLALARVALYFQWHDLCTATAETLAPYESGPATR